jgi:hypothetical protein
LGGKTYRVKRAAVHPKGAPDRDRPPEVDLAVLELDGEVGGIEPLPVYRGRGETAHSAVLVGVGDFGAAGRPLTRSDRRRRAATNTFADVGPLRLFLTFDAPPGGTDLEGVSGPGDSGGPALIEVGGQWLVAGVSSGSQGKPGHYGLTDVYTRVSAHHEWLSRVLGGAQP